MKKVFSLLIVFALLLSMVGCDGNDDKATIEGQVETVNDNSIFMKYSKFDGAREYTVDIQNPTVIKVQVSTNRGALNIRIAKGEDSPVYTGSLIRSMDFSVNITDPGEYTIALNGTKHSGQYQFDWEETAVEEMTNEVVPFAPTTTTQPVNTELEDAHPRAIYTNSRELTYKDADPSKYTIYMAIQTDTKIENFQYLRLSVEMNDEGKVFCSSKSVLYKAKTLEPDEPFITGTIIEGLLPSRGIAYTDASGQHICTITMSGENGDLLLTEILPRA